MVADPNAADTPETPPRPVDAHATGHMTWVMVAWLIAFLVVVVFGIISYLFGWWYQRTHNQVAAARICFPAIACHDQSSMTDRPQTSSAARTA